MKRTRGLLAVCLLTAGCGAPASSGLGYQTCELRGPYAFCDPSAPLPSGYLEPPAPVDVVVSATTFAGVRTGTPLEEALPRLTRLLGPPEVEDGSCRRAELEDTLAQPLRGDRLSWDLGELQALFTRPAADRPSVLTGWEVRTTLRPPSRFAVDLPFDVQLGDEVEDARYAFPDALPTRPTTGPDAGGRLLRTPDIPHLSFSVTEVSGGDVVHGASYDPAGCR